MPTQSPAPAAALLMLVVPMTVYLAAPTTLDGDVAQAQCERLVTERLDGSALDAKAQWELLPAAHWSCTTHGNEVADFGWWAGDSSAIDATLTN
jgi:hypothetical protein